MAACFAQLQKLVPGLTSHHGKLSKVELLQHVIDYIVDLELTLGCGPSSISSSPSSSASSYPYNVMPDSRRSPLGECTLLNICVNRPSTELNGDGPTWKNSQL